jgi:hypothetical protein
MKEKTDKSELEMINEFYSYINNILKINNKKVSKFYHWSMAEVLSYNRFKNKNKDTVFNDSNYKFYDLYNVFIKEPVVIKGAFNYSLKTIAKSLYELSMCKTIWDSSSPCSNGLTAMILANKIYDNSDIKCVASDKTMKEIENYNEVDCKVLYEIHNLMKTNL